MTDARDLVFGPTDLLVTSQKAVSWERAAVRPLSGAVAHVPLVGCRKRVYRE
jgi:hypothetical protein